MDHVSYTELRQNLKKHMDGVCENRAPLVVTRQNGEPVVMLSLAEYESLEETLHLLQRSRECRAFAPVDGAGRSGRIRRIRSG